MKREWQRRLDFFLGGEGYSPFERLHHGFLILGSLFFFFTSILYIIFSSPPRSLFTRTFISLLILSPVVLISIEAFFPSWIPPYPFEEERLLDLMLSYLLTAPF